MAARTLALIVLLGALAAPARADDRELKARESFAAGRYREALDAYAKLYAETLHPTYLRNVGRCYQNLEEPDNAIKSFREYLRKAPDLPPAQRAEVEGYIREMEALKRQREPEARPAPAPGGTRWWLWAGLGAVVVGGAVAALLLAGGSKTPAAQTDLGTTMIRW